MSRIHEALRKAEEERVLRPPLAAPPEAMEAAASGRESEPGRLPDNGANLVEPISFASLSVRCARPAWTPDSARMLFFDSATHSGIGAEEFRTFRSRLYRIREKQPLKTILITSPLPGEGKTFLAGNLTQMMVRQHGRRALLIDGDLRWSRLHQYLGAPQSPGLAEYLQGTADEYAILQHGPMENFFFIPGGMQPSHPAELIANGRLKLLIQRLAPLFDWVIIDSPPVVPVSDAAIMGEACDGVLIVVRAARTPYEMAQRAREELKDRPILGVVLNGVVPEGAGYDSYYYYKKYYKRYEKQLMDAEKSKGEAGE